MIIKGVKRYIRISSIVLSLKIPTFFPKLLENNYIFVDPENTLIMSFKMSEYPPFFDILVHYDAFLMIFKMFMLTNFSLLGAFSNIAATL